MDLNILLCILLVSLVNDLVVGSKPKVVGISLGRENSGAINKVNIGHLETLVITTRFPDGVTQDVNVVVKASLTTTTVFTISDITRNTVGSDIGDVGNPNWFTGVTLSPGTASNKIEAGFDLGNITNDGTSNIEENSYIKIFIKLAYISIGNNAQGDSYSPKVSITYGASGTYAENTVTYILYGSVPDNRLADDEEDHIYDKNRWTWLALGSVAGLVVVCFFVISMFIIIRYEQGDEDVSDEKEAAEDESKYRVTRIYQA